MSDCQEGKNGRIVVIVSASSDIGIAMCRRWLARGWCVVGTYRTRSEALEELEENGLDLVKCDLGDPASVSGACRVLREEAGQWDILVVCAGLLDPIGAFASVDFDEWDASISVNFINTVRVVHEMLPARRRGGDLGPCVLFFAGGGTNGATVNYSAYTISKIALIKMCELLDAEIEDTRFTIVGPGWVKTKIHEATLKAGARAGDNLQRTVAQLECGQWTSTETVLDCCDWIVDAPRPVVGGRNISVAFDRWGTDELEQKLAEDADFYKLRRHGNDWTA